MVKLTRAHQELFRRAPDERFSSLEALVEHCRNGKSNSQDRWHLPQRLLPKADDNGVSLTLEDAGDFRLNNWSFSQLCRMSGISKDTINRLSAETASRALRETLPQADKPLQVLTTDHSVRAIHGVAYTRLWNIELLDAVREVATDFQPPQEATGGGTGLYCGEQDLFCFLIDPNGWAEIESEAFAPGFFVWNSEVGSRTVGVQTFWFQAVCQNHIVWDAVEVVDFKRKHTANVHEALTDIQKIVEQLVEKRDARRDGFVQVLRNATRTKLGDDAEEVAKTLTQNGIPKNLGQKALEIARQQGSFTIFSLVDALTRLTQQEKYVGQRVEIDEKVSSLLALAM